MDYPSWVTERRPAWEICPCCGIQFGYDDFGRDVLAFDLREREMLHRAWRLKWIAGGMRFWSPRALPFDWDPLRQLRNAGLDQAIS